MQMLAIDCVPGSVTYLRPFVSSGILALHPHVFDLFFSHLFYFQAQQMHMKHACYMTSSPSCPLLYKCSAAAGAIGSDHPLSSSLPLQSQTRFYTRYHNTSAFSTSSSRGRHCSFSFNSYVLYRNRTAEAILTFSFNWATEKNTGF